MPVFTRPVLSNNKGKTHIRGMITHAVLATFVLLGAAACAGTSNDGLNGQTVMEETMDTHEAGFCQDKLMWGPQKRPQIRHVCEK
ncbi:hypothetical protein [Granulibacter bethesdensis]|uniref:hypothetical protein n=1 Tax=Granulibacter bethesdensis TaxID=364410 RepID=UPI0004B78698|nr:hypothetical protein [Granulibacter bethesdensis]